MNFSAFNQKQPIIFHKSIKIIATIFLTIYLIIWAISSPLSKHFIKPILLEKGLFLSPDTSIRYNPFLSQLTVNDLTLYNEKRQITLSINTLSIRLTLLRLLFDEIAVSKFELNGAYLKIEKTPTQLIIAGIDFNRENSNKKLKQDIKTEASPFLYQFLLPKLTLKQVNLDINNNEQIHKVTIEKLFLSQIKANQQYQQATLSLQSIVDNAPLKLVGNANVKQGQGEINSQISINNYPLKKLQHYADGLSELSGFISLSSKQQIIITPEQLKLHIAKAQLSNSHLFIGFQQQFFSLEKLENTIKNLKLTLNQGKITKLSGTSQLILNNADIYHEIPSQKLIHFEQLALNDISFHVDGSPQVKVSHLVIDNIYGSKNEDSNIPPLVSLKKVTISDILVGEQQLTVNKIILDTLQSDVILSKDSALANLVKLPVTEAEKEEASDVIKELDQEINSNNTDFSISLNEFSLTGENQLSLIDNSVEPVKKRLLYIDTLYLGPLSNTKAKQNLQTPFKLIGRSNQYAHFNFKGFIQPFAEIPTYHVQGFLKELSLPAVSRYMKKAMQMKLKNGQLNTNIDVTLTGDELDGNIVILLQGLETAIADSNEVDALIDQGALPFNMAINMLKDNHGDVELDVPLSGSTSDPQFGMRSIVALITQKATWMATQEYLMTTFVPYGNIVSVAMRIGEFALKLRFDDLIYQVKQIEPNESQQVYLQAFIKLMQDKEDTRINICAISTPADIDIITNSQIIDKDHILQLNKIAEKREEAFKDYIIKHGNIASSRLLLCAPKIDFSDNAQPRIELSI